MLDATIEVRGTPGLNRKLAALGTVKRDMLLLAGQAMKSETARGIQQGVDINSRPFAPISPLTQAVRPGGSGKPLQDRGLLLQSILAPEPRVVGDRVTIGTNREGADMVNYGGTQRPKNTKVLAIPMNRRAKLAGSPRQFKDGFWRRTARGSLIFFVPDGRGGVTPMFLGKDRVEIPKRQFLGWGERIRKPVMASVQASLRRVLVS